MAPPRSPPPRAHAIAFILAVVRPKRHFPSITGAMAITWPHAAGALSAAPSSPFSSMSNSPWHREAAALPRLPSQGRSWRTAGEPRCHAAITAFKLALVLLHLHLIAEWVQSCGSLCRARWWSPFDRRPHRWRVLATSDLPPIGCMTGGAFGPTASHRARFRVHGIGWI
jgi:hypothetical protein